MNDDGTNNSVVYLDNHATTPCDPAVVDAMLFYFTEAFGNPSSSLHPMGKKAAEAVQNAKAQVASLIGSSPAEIIFTSGATESNNLAVLGLVRGLASHTERKRIVTTKLEHKAVLEPCQELSKQGYELVYLPVDKQGRVELEPAGTLINEDTLLVSVQAASNEIGTVQPVRQLAELTHARGALFHTDAAQAVGKISVDVDAWDVDLLSISAHKLYGPKGVGALYVRGGPRGLPIKPLWFGGGQEAGVRSGTVNVPGVVGLGKACELCEQLLPEEQQRTELLRDQLEREILEGITNVRRNGDLENRLPNNSSLTFRGIDAEALIMNMPELALSTGSACTSGALEPSHVLTAIGLSREDAYSTVRVGLGRFTTQEDVAKAAEIMVKAHASVSAFA